MTEQIPGPSGLPFLGNMFDVQSDEGYLKATERLADIYGSVFKTKVGGYRMIHVSSAELLMEFADDRKYVSVPLDELSKDEDAKGLFNAHYGHPDWGQARRILQPSFGPLAIESTFEGMRDIANQMCMKWARMGDGHQVLLTDDFTRLTLDTIALCAMDYRFNSFYKDELHPFINAMVTYLYNSGEIANRPWIVNMLLPRMATDKKAAKKLLDTVAQQIIDHRRSNPVPGKDILNLMLFGEDPKTGQVMRDSLIRENMIAFLVAGHETTSSLLSFAVINMLQNPSVFLKARREVDEAIGSGRIELAHLKKLKYLNGILRETLRLTPTIPSLAREIHPNRKSEFITICDGKYHIGPDSTVEVILTKAQRDPTYFGADANEFKPERMMDDNPRLSKFIKAWKPFGNGARACIGQSFAWQEAMQILALILQNFDLSLSDSSYQMRIKETLTIKPDELYVRVRLRKGITADILEKRLFNKEPTSDNNSQIQNPPEKSQSDIDPSLTIAFGSNSGTCQSLAQKLASRMAVAFKIGVSVRDLDSMVDSLPQCPLVIITASYEGLPPDNAGQFVSWLEDSKALPASGIKYAVLGVGNKNWQTTYQRVPKIIDSILELRGAERLLPLATIDVSEANIMDELEIWDEEHLRKAFRSALGNSQLATSDSYPEPEAEISTSHRATTISNGMVLGKVLSSRILTGPGQPEKRHIEIELPSESKYECGDYLAVLPLNGKHIVRRIMAHWNLPLDSTVILKSETFRPLLIGVPLSVSDILTGYFELSQPPSKKALQTCMRYTADQQLLEKLKSYFDSPSAHESSFVEGQVSLLELLVRNPQIKIPFPVYLSTLIPLRPRQYSISSSPMENPTTYSLTYGVLRSSSEDPLKAAFEGVASNYLANLEVGDTLQVSVRRTATANKPCPFRIPADQNKTPLLMIGAGTGLAPFRGFIQQRAKMIELNNDRAKDLAPAVLFIGCRSQTEDRLYSEEMDHWQKIGAVELRYSFSREPAKSNGCKYVGDRMWADRVRVKEFWDMGARLYVCGRRQLMTGIEDAMLRILEESVLQAGGDKEMVDREKDAFWEECTSRAVSDVFE